MTPNFVGFLPANACHNPTRIVTTRKLAPMGTHAGSPNPGRVIPQPTAVTPIPISRKPTAVGKATRVRLPQAKASLVPAIRPMKQAAPTAVASRPVTPSNADLRERGPVWASAKPMASTRKHSAVVGDMRPGFEVCVVMYPAPRISSIPKLARSRYSRSVATASAPVIAAPRSVNRGFLHTTARRASPIKAKLTAVLRCIGARCGAT